MWFHDEELLGRRGFTRRRNTRRKPILRVNTRGGGQKQTIGRRVAVVAMAAFIVGGLTAVVWYGARFIGGVLFSRNPEYVIRNVRIDDGGDIPTYFIRERKHITEGVNLFGFNIAKLRNEFMSQRYSARYRSMEVTRVLPDTLKVSVSERTPLARLGRGGLVVDRAGVVFGLGAGRAGLPLIIGHRTRGLRPGDRIGGPARLAVTVLDQCEKTEVAREVDIVGIDVAGDFAGMDDDVRLYLADRASVDLWWPKRGRGGETPLKNLDGRLLYLRDFVRDARERGRQLKHVDLTLESYLDNSAASYWN